jgi:hypothetical protein
MAIVIGEYGEENENIGAMGWQLEENIGCKLRRPAKG